MKVLKRTTLAAFVTVLAVGTLSACSGTAEPDGANAPTPEASEIANQPGVPEEWTIPAPEAEFSGGIVRTHTNNDVVDIELHAAEVSKEQAEDWLNAVAKHWNVSAPAVEEINGFSQGIVSSVRGENASFIIGVSEENKDAKSFFYSSGVTELSEASVDIPEEWPLEAPSGEVRDAEVVKNVDGEVLEYRLTADGKGPEQGKAWIDALVASGWAKTEPSVSEQGWFYYASVEGEDAIASAQEGTEGYVTYTWQAK